MVITKCSYIRITVLQAGFAHLYSRLYVIGFEMRGNFAHKYFFQYSLLNVCDPYILLYNL